ncbi:MAG: putative baseplate assembly protein [Exilibacterium sp.]
MSEDQLTLYAYFLGKLPQELRENKPGLEQFLTLEGGKRITGIDILDVDPQPSDDPEKDDVLVIHLSRYGDFSRYRLKLQGIANIDPRYAEAEFSFKVACPSDLDCGQSSCTEPACSSAAQSGPLINYLAKDYASFRQLILDRLGTLIPEWRERHVPDLGITLVELLAYTGDYLSYYQDAVATEAYLDTARQRISLRRHARLVDYSLHEGCNARGWVCLQVSSDIEIDVEKISFITGLNNALPATQTLLSSRDLKQISSDAYEVFEPLVAETNTALQLRRAHNEIFFYTWGDNNCFLSSGSTSATMLDSWLGAEDRALQLQVGDILIFEEVVGAKTGLPADANPTSRHAVRLTEVRTDVDTLNTDEQNRPLPIVHIEWAEADALPFSLCISSISAAPGCYQLQNISVARGNCILVDHGKTLEPEDLGCVAAKTTSFECECPQRSVDIVQTPQRFNPQLKKFPITYATPLPPISEFVPASVLRQQSVCSAQAQVNLVSQPPQLWRARRDLLDSYPQDTHFVVETDNQGVAHLRFGDGELGYQPLAGMAFSAQYRIGNGEAGNVGAEAVSRVVLKDLSIDGIDISVRNPLPMVGGTAPETLAQVRALAPHSFRKSIQRAIIAQDYRDIALRDGRLQSVGGKLVWTGSWYEASVAVDPLRTTSVDTSLLQEICTLLHPYRRMGHDLRVTAARYVPLDLQIKVCAAKGYQSAHVKAALLNAFSNRQLANNQYGFFHPDSLSFGEDIYISKIIAKARQVTGVASVKVSRCQRLFQAANHELEHGVLTLHSDEIAQLDNNPNYPERGKLDIVVCAQQL